MHGSRDNGFFGLFSFVCFFFFFGRGGGGGGEGLDYEGIEDPNTTKIWPSSNRQRNAIEMAFRSGADDGPTMNAGLVAMCLFRGSGSVLLRNPIALCLSGGVCTRCPPLWVRACVTAHFQTHTSNKTCINLWKHNIVSPHTTKVASSHFMHGTRARPIAWLPYS